MAGAARSADRALGLAQTKIALRGEVAHWGGSVAFIKTSLKRAVSAFLCKGVAP